ncbi:MAG: hypothetical protein R3324_08075 [Halobacteriales archaeon]|nr:hypothetical protein [Halobacteriales archaeon]
MATDSADVEIAPECERVGCHEVGSVEVFSTVCDETFLFCPECAEDRLETFTDMSLVDEDADVSVRVAPSEVHTIGVVEDVHEDGTVTLRVAVEDTDNYQFRDVAEVDIHFREDEDGRVTHARAPRVGDLHQVYHEDAAARHWMHPYTPRLSDSFYRALFDGD